MALRAWRIWGSSVVLATGLSTPAKPPDVPAGTDVAGKVPPPVTQDHFQPDRLPPPRLLPESITDSKPRHGPETAGLQLPDIGPVDLDVPIRISPGDKYRRGPRTGGPSDWKARVAFDMAEEHRRSCDVAEARQWYREAIKLAPGSTVAQAALERLREGQVVPAGAAESREPPLADSDADLPSLQLRVLWEAARQFKDAVDSGDQLHIEKCGRTLDTALRQTAPIRNR